RVPHVGLAVLARTLVGRLLDLGLRDLDLFSELDVVELDCHLDPLFVLFTATGDAKHGRAVGRACVQTPKMGIYESRCAFAAALAARGRLIVRRPTKLPPMGSKIRARMSTPEMRVPVAAPA